MKLTTGLRSENSWVFVINSLLYAHAAHCEGEALWCLIKAFLLRKTIWYIKYEYFYNHCLGNRIPKSCLYENAVVVLWFHSPKCLKGFQRMPKFLKLNCLQSYANLHLSHTFVWIYDSDIAWLFVLVVDHLGKRLH